MKPELKDNSTFLRYYEILQVNPSSVVFAPLAELLILHGLHEEAVTVCKKGLEKNPGLISGRLALAKAYYNVSNLKRAEEEAENVLNICAGHPGAAAILAKCREKMENPKEDESIAYSRPSAMEEDESGVKSINPLKDSRWSTITMARIFASQGNADAAREICGRILEAEPGNKQAMEELKRLKGV